MYPKKYKETTQRCRPRLPARTRTQKVERRRRRNGRRSNGERERACRERGRGSEGCTRMDRCAERIREERVL